MDRPSTSPAPASRVPLRKSRRVIAAFMPRLSDTSILPKGPLQERRDPGLVAGGQLLQRKRDRPHGAVVELRFVAEAQRRIPCLELRRTLEMADDLVVLGIRGHSVPQFRLETRRIRLDDSMEPLTQRTIGFRHRGELRKDDT